MSAQPGKRRRRSTEDLLDGVLPYALDAGLKDFSVRAAAQSADTTHQVLLNHFGSREGLVAALLRRVREQVRDDLGPDRADAARRYWDWYAEHPGEYRLLIQGIGLALIDPDTYGEIGLDSITQFRGEEAEAGDPARLRLAIAAVRGLLIDRYVTGDDAGTTAALERLAGPGGG